MSLEIFIVEEESGEQHVYFSEGAANKRMNFIESTAGSATMTRGELGNARVVRETKKEAHEAGI